MSSFIEEQPVLVKKKIVHKRGHSSGAWKVAFADFAIAMMAFFLVLWMHEATSVEEKLAISGYFKQPSTYSVASDLAIQKLRMVENGEAEPLHKEDLLDLSPDNVEALAQALERQKFDALLQTLRHKIDSNAQLRNFSNQLIMSVSGEGLVIQIVDRDARPMFESGSFELQYYTEGLLNELAETINSVPNKIRIAGHTDSARFTGRPNYSNWELSSERANAARRALTQGGLADEKIAEVVGHADSVLFDLSNPLNPMNRRITILVMSSFSEEAFTKKTKAGFSQLKASIDKDEESDSKLERTLEPKEGE